MKLQTLLAAAAVVALAAAGATVVVAQEKQETRQETRKVIMVMGGDAKDCNVEIKTFMRGPAFDDIDANKDGAISKAEFDAFHSAHHPGDKMDMPMPPPPCGDEHDGPGGEHSRVMIRHMGDLDANKDGKVTFDEFVAPMKEHFDKMDANHDGVLQGDEMPKMHVEMRKEMHGDTPPPADH